jgi:5-methylcytosine-specific restriction endonuclease McrA
MQLLLDAALTEKMESKFKEKSEENITAKMTVTKTTVAKNSRYIPVNVKQTVMKRAEGQCESLLRETRDRCQEKRGLEFDHIKPFALGGTNDLKNIRLLCRNCNQREAFKVFGDASHFAMSFI